MGITKDIWIEEYDNIISEAEENGVVMDETKAGELAHERSIERFAGMCDAAKDRAKYDK